MIVRGWHPKGVPITEVVGLFSFLDGLRRGNEISVSDCGRACGVVISDFIDTAIERGALIRTMESVLGALRLTDLCDKIVNGGGEGLTPEELDEAAVLLQTVGPGGHWLGTDIAKGMRRLLSVGQIFHRCSISESAAEGRSLVAVAAAAAAAASTSAGGASVAAAALPDDELEGIHEADVVEAGALSAIIPQCLKVGSNWPD